jgi:hypothetical protein
MSFKYNPTDAGAETDIKEGEYPYRIDDIEEKRFGSGNEGWKMTLAVPALPEREVKVYCNVVNTKNSLWLMRKLCKAHGRDFAGGEQTPGDFIGQCGRAKFIKNEKGYLEVADFIPA